MGNGSSCCSYSSPPQVRRPQVDNTSTGEAIPDWKLSSHANLPHISEREPDDFEANPSIHAKAGTLFMERSKASENGMVRKKSLSHIADTGRLKKSNSCSTIYLDDNTVSQPNLKNTVKCVALAIYYHIKNRTSDRLLDIFEERLYPLARDPVPDNYNQHNPEHRHIYKFIRALFNAAQLTAECAIITLVYLERLHNAVLTCVIGSHMPWFHQWDQNKWFDKVYFRSDKPQRLLTLAEIDITPGNWKRIVLGAILLASKVWDDQAVWNVDYCQILKDITVEDMNELERQFLEMLQFNINVPSSVYAKYYFDLRTLAEDNDLAFPSQPLSKDRAQKLEAMSRKYQDKIIPDFMKEGKKWASLDDISMGQPRRSVAILS